MTRKALPQNYILDQGVVIEDFETPGDWTPSRCTVETDAVNFKTGTKSLKVTQTTGTDATITKSVSLDLSSRFSSMGFWIYLHNDPSNFKQIEILLTSTVNWSKYCQIVIVNGPFKLGWNYIKVASTPTYLSNIAQWNNVGGESFQNTMIQLRIRVTPNTDCLCTFSLDALYAGIKAMPRVVLYFDDGFASDYDAAYAYMATRGVKGTSSIVSNLIGTVGCLTLAQMQEMYEAGWTFTNHTFDHTDITTLTTEQDVEAKIQPCTQWLIDNSMPRGAYHFVYPGGGGYNISYVLQALSALEIKTARCGAITAPQSAPVTDYHALVCASASTMINLDYMKKLVNNAISQQTTQILVFHKLVESNPTGSEWSIADFQALIEYIVQLKIKVVTIDEWYEGLTNPRYRSVPLSRATA